MTEEFRINLAEFVDGCDKLRRRGGITFHEERKKRLDEAIKASMDDLLKAQGDISFVKGVKSAVRAIAIMLRDGNLRLNDYSPDWVEVWLAHVASTEGACGCQIDSDWDGGHEIDLCKAYQDKDFQRLWYLAYHGMTEEELQEREREAARLEFEKKKRAQEEYREQRRKQLYQLAREFDVDPKYLP